MRRQSSLFPKNKAMTSKLLFQLPLKNNSFSYERYNTENPNEKSVLPKSHKITKLIKEIKNSNPVQFPTEQTNLYNYQKLLLEEKIKNKNYCDIIASLKKQIEEMESKFDLNGQNINDEIMRLRRENQELKIFKEKVYSFSVKYDEINRDIINCLKSIEELVQIFNDDYSNYRENEEYRNNNLNKISYNFKSIVNNLYNFMKIKQSEYNILLIEKDKEIQDLKTILNNINSETYSIGLKSSRGRNLEAKKMQFNKKNLNNINDFDNANQSFGTYKIYKTNEFDY
jgi:hypothetical protein